MQLLKKTTFAPHVGQALFTVRVAALLGLLLAAAAARGQAYYSSSSPIVTTPTPYTCSTLGACGGVQVGSSAQLNDLTLAANVYAAQNPVRVQLPLTGTAPAGYRAGMLVSSLGSLVNLDLLRTATLRTYLDNVPQQEQVVDLAALKARLLAGNGSPEQLEFDSPATMPFNRVELELGSVTSLLGEGLRVQYAYGLASNSARQVTGYVSRFTASAGQYEAASCTGGTSGINNPERTVNNNLTDYATFGSIASLNCPMKLKVNLEGTSPGGYRAGFVVGGKDNLLNADLLGGVQLRTYKNGVLQESATGASLLELSVLPSGQSLVSFKTASDKPFDAVSIERNGVVTALDNLQLYYGTGVPTTPATQVRSNWGSPATHFSTYSNGVLCVSPTGCSVSNGANAADNDLANFATLNVTAGLANVTGLRLDLNGGGKAGNRAGMVLAHQGGLLDLNALSRVTLITYDAGGNVLETHTGSSLLQLETLPDGRQAISFNSTRDFATVGISMAGLLNVDDTTNIYYAFADDSNGQVNILAPPSPLPVVLVSLAVRRPASAGPVEISWTTASELNSLSFVVERSIDPAAGFVALGQVVAAGNSATTRQYSLRDAEATGLRGILYYRLRQLDRDNTATLSKVLVLAACPAPAELSLYPNPATAATPVTLATGSLPAGATVSVYSSRGQLLSNPAAADGAAVVAVPTAGLVPGLYYVVLRTAAGQALGTQRLRIAGE